ncbi:MAG: dual specificity protein phosphatase family protein [Planctomycetaceae bacterium]|nr:dual specificity protein phosphatase family protein [Planctomycetaceae bacterium]MCB9952011.1 dual specificity protein phosphatase family protein [Planctomycetaceae bacterium]
MQKIPSFPLWIGNTGDGRDHRVLAKCGVHAVLQLAGEEPALEPPLDVMHFRIPILDSVGNISHRLILASNVLTTLLTNNITTLVCCSDGNGRSLAIAACAIGQLNGQTPFDSLKFVQEHHATSISAGLWNDLLLSYSQAS